MARATIDLQDVLGSPHFSVEQFENHWLDTVVAVKIQRELLQLGSVSRALAVSGMLREWHQPPTTLRALLCGAQVSVMSVVKG